MNATPLLRLTDFGVSFKGEYETVSALRDFNAEIGQGEWVALVGESGSGKSVTALSILRLLPSTADYSGKLILFDKGKNISLTEIPEAELYQIRGRKISMIFQEPMSSLNPVIRCGDQIVETIRRHRNLSESEARQEAISLLDQVKLPEPEKIHKRYPHELSGGQKQRVMIAVAISCNPSLLICDEPTTALDPEVSQSILLLLRELQKSRGMSILFITHDLGILESVADRILVLYKGQLVESGSTEAVFQRPLHPYTQALLACRPGLYPPGTLLPVVEDFLSGNRNAKPSPIEISPKESPVKREILLEIRNLTVTHSRNEIVGRKKTSIAVDKANFSIFRGETLGLTGPSGSGKTTLGRAILNLIPSEAGSEVLYDGINLAGLNRSQWQTYRKKFQLIFQDPYSSLNPSMTAGQLIAEPMEVHGIGVGRSERQQRVKELLESVQLPRGAINRYPREFSGGQRQRIGIARALALNPEFLVCDESVSALDVSVQAQVLNLLNELKSRFSLTLLFISHNHEVVNYFCDRIIRIEQGKVLNG